MSIIYKNRTRSKDNINNNFVNALDSGTTTINASTITASNLSANSTIKTDANKVLVSSLISQTDLDFTPSIYSGTLPAPVGNLLKIANVNGNNEESTITETDITTLQTDVSNLQNDKLNIDGTSIMTGNLQMGFNSLTNVTNITAENVYTNNIFEKTVGGDIFLNNDTTLINHDLYDIKRLETGTLAGQSGDILVDNNFNMNNNNILNCNNVQTQEIKSTDGVSINIQDDINMGLYDINNCNEIRTNAISVNTASNIVSNNNIDMNTNDILDVGNLNVSSINNLSPVGGIYSGISDGATISSSTFTDLLPISSVGGLSVPANTFLVGSAFHLVCAGVFPSESKNDEIEVELCAIQGASTIQLGLVRLELENFDTAPSNFELEADFVIRSIGVTGEVAVSFDFTFNKQITKDFKGTRATNLATIDTTQASTLELNARIIGAGGSSIKSTLAYLRKQY